MREVKLWHFCGSVGERRSFPRDLTEACEQLAGLAWLGGCVVEPGRACGMMCDADWVTLAVDYADSLNYAV